jgi:sec-independent protein translocase protein TatB
MLGISPWEFAAIAVIALLIFGPDKLPKLAADAGRLLREIRRLATGAKRDLQDSIGPELGDLNLSDLNPATFVKKNLLDPVDEEVKGVKRAVNDPDGRRGSEGAAAGSTDPSDGDGADPPPPRIDADTI